MPAQEEIMDAIRHMSVADLLDLARALKEEMEGRGDSAGAETARMSGAGLSLQDFGADRVEVIRAVREITDLGLREARELAAASPAQVAAWGHDADTDTDADGTEGAGVPAKPRTPPPTGAGSEQLPIPGARVGPRDFGRRPVRQCTRCGHIMISGY